MVILIVKMEVTKTRPFVINELVMPKRTLLAKTDDAFRSYGCVISIMIVEMIQMNQRICAVNETVQLGGRDVLVNPITGVFPNGCSAMERMIVEIIAMNFQKIVQSVTRKLTSSARTTVAFPNNGCVILLTIVAMEVMKKKITAKENIANVQSQNFVVEMVNVFQVVGYAIMKMIVATILTRSIVKDSNVKMVHSSAHPATVLLLISVVMVIEIVAICLMKLIVHHVSQEADTVQNRGFNVQTICAFHHQICAMEPTTAVTIQMNQHQFVPISIVTI
jgi:hypothetical protein